jgi:hypothetical protein
VQSPTSPRNPLTRARFFLAQAEALSGTEREAFNNYLQAAIVFGRSVYQYLQSLADASGVDPGYRKWFNAKRTVMAADPILEYFRNSRDLLIHHRHLPVAKRTSRTASAAAYVSDYAEMKVGRGQPWYRRSRGVLWQDAKATVMRPVHRWRHRVGEAVKRRRRVLGEKVEARRTQQRDRKVEPTVRQFYLDDPEGLDRPAVDLVRTYLDRLEVIVGEAEARFPTVVG